MPERARSNRAGAPVTIARLCGRFRKCAGSRWQAAVSRLRPEASAGAALAAAHAPRAVTIPFLDRRFQPQLDEPRHLPVDDAPGHRFEEVRVRNRVEVVRQIGVYHVMARWIARPPKAAFVTRLRPAQLPKRAARQTRSIDYSLGGIFLHR